jgi:hypothetical protein
MLINISHKIIGIEVYTDNSEDLNSLLAVSGRHKGRIPQPKDYGCPKRLFSTVRSKCTTLKLNTL